MVSEKMVIVNGQRLPLSAIKPHEDSKVSKGKNPEPTIEPDKGHPILALYARLKFLKEDKEVEKLENELPELVSLINKTRKKVDLLGIAELLDVAADESMKVSQIKDLILLPLQIEEEDPEL